MGGGERAGAESESGCVCLEQGQSGQVWMGKEGEETVRKDRQTPGDRGLGWGACLLCCGGLFKDGKMSILVNSKSNSRTV